MTDTNKLFLLAQLAEASYADFTKSDKKKALTEDGSVFSTTQADNFLLHWTVASHQKDTASGFSATLFQYKGTDPNGINKWGRSQLSIAF